MSSLASPLALDDVVHLEDLRLAGKLDPGINRHGHQLLAKRGELLYGVPDLADLEVALRPEADVELEAVRGKLPRLSQPPEGLVVFSRLSATRG